MDELPGNSHRERQGEARAKKSPSTPAKNVERIVEGRVIRRKKPLGRRVKEFFLGGGEGSIWDFLREDILIPALQDTTHDVITQGAERAIFGQGEYRGRSGRRGRSRGRTDYSRYSRDPRSREEPRRMSHRGRANFNFEEIILDSRAEAEDVIDHLFMLIEKFDMATVADLYDMIGIESTHTDEKYGWEDLRAAGIDRISNGYLLDLPRPEPID